MSAKTAGGTSRREDRRQARALLDWFGHHARDLPWRRSRDPYAIWISEIMLQQTQVKTVIPYWERWMRHFPDPAALAAAPIEDVLKAWEGLGYYSRARNIHRSAQIIVESHQGRFPSRPEDIRQLPGIGPYTAGAIESIAFGLASPVLDGNVIRILTRWGAINGDPKSREVSKRLWLDAARWVGVAASSIQEPDACGRFNQALMELGAILCTPAAPQCGKCPVKSGCIAFAKGRAGEFPAIPKRMRATPRRFLVAVVEEKGRIAICQRPDGGVNAGLWEFPSLEISPESDARQVRTRLTGWLGLEDVAIEALGVVRHSITRYRITQEAFRATALPAGWRSGEWTRTLKWATPDLIDALAMSAAHRRISKMISKAIRIPGRR